MRQLNQRDRNVDKEINPLTILWEFGWTHQRLAEEMDWSVSAVSKWSAGLHQPSRRARRDAYRVYVRLTHN